MHAKIPTKNSRKPVERNELLPEKLECHNSASDAGGREGVRVEDRVTVL